MAIDKAIDSAQLDKEMLATANAIRTKGGKEEAIPWEKDTGYEQAVLAIKGGGDLNFEIVGGTTAPENPAENTIWVNTDQEITAWSLSPYEPSAPVEGMVWLETSTSERTSFNAVVENEIRICLSRAKQFTSGAWDSADVMLWKDGEWKKMGDIIVSPGFTKYPWSVKGANWNSSTAQSNSPTIKLTDEGVVFQGTTWGYGMAYIGPIDLTDYDTITVDGSFLTDGSQKTSLAIWSSIGPYISSNMVTYKSLTETGAELPVAGFDGNYYVGVAFTASSQNLISNLMFI